MRVFLILLFLGPASAGLVRAASQQTYSNAGLAAPFDNLLGSARSVGMAGAFTGEEDDASYMLQNPAGLGELKTGQAALHHQNFIADVMQETVVVGVPAGGLGGVGLQANYVNYGYFDGRDEAGLPTRPLGASDLGLGLGWGRQIHKRLYFGATLKTERQTLADQAYDSYAGDAGLLLALGNGFRAGISYANFGTSLGGSSRAGEMRMSASFTVNRPGDVRLLVGTGYDYQPMSAARLRFGLEPSYKGLFFLRAGYQIPIEILDREGVQGLSLGAGFRAGSVQVDYAYMPFADLGNIQRVSVAYLFGKAPVEKAVQPQPLAAVLPPPVPVAPAPAYERPKPVTQTGEGLELYFQVPKDPLAQVRELAGQGKNREALEACRQAVAKQPGNAAAWKEMGVLYQRLGQNDYALKCFQEADRILSQPAK